MMIKTRFLVSALALSVALGVLPARAQIFGPSDEEKAHEAGQDSGIRDLQGAAQQQDARTRALEDKVQGLTSSLSQATGTNEELQHQIQVQNDKIDRMQKDFAYRLCTLSAQQMGAGDSMNCAAAGTASAAAPAPYAAPPGGLQPGAPLPPIDATGNGPSGFNGGGNFNSAPPSDDPPPPGGEPIRGRPPGTLGTLPSGPGAGAPFSGSMAGPGNSSQYDAAMNLLSRAQYAEASAAFRAYADANPGDTNLAPQAVYWVANISFTRQDYAGAARGFAEVIKKYPKSSRAPDAMLRLGQSFMSLGQKSEGCTTLGLLRKKYPNASPQTLASAASLRRTACQ